MVMNNKTLQTTTTRGVSKLVILALGGVLLLQPLQSGAVIYAADTTQSQTQTTQAAVEIKTANAKLTQQKQEMIASGVKRVDYVWSPTKGSGTVNIHVIEIDLTNPYVQLNAISGKNNTVASLNNVLNMAKESGAIAAINADVFQTGSSSEGSPMGPQITSGTLMSGPMALQGMYAFSVSKDKVPSIDLYGFDGKVTAADGTTFPIAGMNESAYTTEPDKQPSHKNAIYLYTNSWAADTHPKDSSTTPTEVLVSGGIVQQISDGTSLTVQPPADGYILRAHGTAAQFVREHLTVGSAVTSDYNLVSKTTGAKIDASSMQMMVGGHTILVDQGKAATFSRDITGVSGGSNVYRSAVGYTKDAKKVLLFTAEGTSTRNGMSLKELQEAMVGLGVWKGVNLDGGGSTTMVERPLGEFALKVTHPTTGGTYLRPVANGIGVFSTAPQGTLKGLVPSGSSTLFIGQTTTFSLKAYDNYYNPVDASALQQTWKSAGSIGMFAGNTFTALKSGKGTVTVTSSGITGESAVSVIGADQIASMSIDASAAGLAAGTNITANVKITTKDGLNLTVPPESIKWEFKGFKATTSSNVISITSVNDGAAAGYAIARYDGYPVMLTLTKGSAPTMWESFENVGYGITFQGTDGAAGKVAIVSGLQGKETSKALQLSYDFTSGIGNGKTLAAYAVLNGTGKSVSGSPTGMQLDVYGDQSFNWLRMEVKDGAGKLQYVDLAKSINWSGWKTLTIDLSSYGLTAPLTIKRIYVANIAQDQDERAATGAIAFDDIQMLYPPVVPELTSPAIKLTIDKKSATVNGAAVKLDTAPIVLSGVTYLPLRFIADSMGAEVAWDQTSKKVTVLRGDKLLELQIGSAEMIANGSRQPAPAAPLIRDGRTLVPLRLISEQLGLSVNWDGATKSVTVQ
ncbi:copper amine oxidase-like protein [Paenibacillus cellulosilyticus]|uniref:Copper amine oxidase-like protein n=1 Tax=Paenibacillus cellulosilyticus TaxID=375489 RepID=A0A2V2Z0I8_9BACL|nr:stalk domain-containing protein [Paenibacillus cellulosilyticus]PWW08367.1 copper amine oxidase-like protein [Paenibacillus cellulosilyticus]QKS47963.1 phosphodiester glycosidase family protein [Paenibacillus cellulosilyticus]